MTSKMTSSKSWNLSENPNAFSRLFTSTVNGFALLFIYNVGSFNSVFGAVAFFHAIAERIVSRKSIVGW